MVALILFLALGVNCSWIKPVVTINSVVNKLQKFKDVQTILVLDEIIPNNGLENFFPDASVASIQRSFDMNYLNISSSNVHLLLAVNPAPKWAGFDEKIKIILPVNSTTLGCQLFTKHRNGFKIAVLLEHFKAFYKLGWIDDSQDIPISKVILPPGRSPVWIQRGKSVHDMNILEHIKANHVLKHESVTVLYHKNHNNMNIILWCSHNKWKCIERNEFYGCEDDVIVIFDIDVIEPEQVSRAKNGLIILTTQG